MVAATPVPAQLPPTCGNVGFKAVHPATSDPTSFADDPGIVLAPGRHVVLDNVRVVLRHKGKVLGSAGLDQLSTSGTVLRLVRPPARLPSASRRGRASSRRPGPAT